MKVSTPTPFSRLNTLLTGRASRHKDRVATPFIMAPIFHRFTIRLLDLADSTRTVDILVGIGEAIVVGVGFTDLSPT
jgi:hypothetical protein